MHFLLCFSDSMGNKGAYINITGDDLKPKFTSYEAVVSRLVSCQCWLVSTSVLPPLLIVVPHVLYQSQCWLVSTSKQGFIKFNPSLGLFYERMNVCCYYVRSSGHSFAIT